MIRMGRLGIYSLLCVVWQLKAQMGKKMTKKYQVTQGILNKYEKEKIVIMGAREIWISILVIKVGERVNINRDKWLQFADINRRWFSNNISEGKVTWKGVWKCDWLCFGRPTGKRFVDRMVIDEKGGVDFLATITI